MGFKINLKILISLVIGLFSLLLSCDNHGYFEEIKPGISYQIYPGERQIFRIRRGDGAYLLQSFDTQSNLLSSVTMATPYPFAMTKFDNDAIEISYFVGKSDLEMFLPWFKTNTFNPNRVSDYKITYSFVVDNGGFSDRDIEIDSIAIKKKTKSACLFLDRKLIEEIPIRLLFVYKNSFRYLDDKKNVLTEYHVKNTMMIKGYLENIISMYNRNQ